MTRTLLIPDLGGAPADHWQAWWTEVEHNAHMLHRADSQGEASIAWASDVADAILANPDTILIAHGDGCAVVAHLLASHAQPLAAGALFVAPTNPDRNYCRLRLSDVTHEELPVPTTVVASRTDRSIDIDEAEHVAADWGSKFVDLGDAGHIDTMSGFGPWPDGIELRDDLIVRARRYVLPKAVRELPAQRWAF